LLIVLQRAEFADFRAPSMTMAKASEIRGASCLRLPRLFDRRRVRRIAQARETFGRAGAQLLILSLSTAGRPHLLRGQHGERTERGAPHVGVAAAMQHVDQIPALRLRSRPVVSMRRSALGIQVAQQKAFSARRWSPIFCMAISDS